MCAAHVLLSPSFASDCQISVMKMDEVAESKGSDAVTHEIDPGKQRALVRKLDLMIVPPVMLLYTFSFLDRYA